MSLDGAGVFIIVPETANAVHFQNYHWILNELISILP